jgi:hypothetical protein
MTAAAQSSGSIVVVIVVDFDPEAADGQDVRRRIETAWAATSIAMGAIDRRSNRR